MEESAGDIMILFLDNGLIETLLPLLAKTAWSGGVRPHCSADTADTRPTHSRHTAVDTHIHTNEEIREPINPTCTFLDRGRREDRMASAGCQIPTKIRPPLAALVVPRTYASEMRSQI